MPVGQDSSVSGVMIVGGRTEPFLSACLESIADAVDLLVVNDNGRSPANRRVLESSRLCSDGRLTIIDSEFRGFSYCRNLCLDHLRDRVPSGSWTLYVDSDEVHPGGLSALTHRVLPNLAASVGIADGYFYNFFQSPNYYISLDRRHNMLFRLHENTRWEGDVHERLVGTQGSRIALPYRYFHYGYVCPAADIAGKWKQYGELGDAVSGDQALHVDAIPRGVARRVLRYRGSHPAAVEVLLHDDAEWVTEFERLARARGADRIVKRLLNANYDVRIAWRAVQSAIRFGFGSALVEMLRGAP